MLFLLRIVNQMLNFIFFEEIVFVVLVRGTEEVPKQCCGVNLNNDLELLF